MTATMPGTTGASDVELKTKHRAMWASGDYPQIATDITEPLGSVLVEASGVERGDRVLDVAAGTGNVAIAAAKAGAHVVASDLTPELFESGRLRAIEHGVILEWHEGDAEALPYGDGHFDKVLSCVGVMFAPHHDRSADELLRVCRRGGTIGLINWTPEGFIGQMFATMKPYAPPAPPGAQPPPLWGDLDHLGSLFGDRVTQVDAHRRSLGIGIFRSAEAFRDYFKENYGPTIAIYKYIAADPERVAALDEDLVRLAERFNVGSDGFAMEWEYLLYTAKKA
ncbi:MAG: class I SAM-dependent methyltransferase [Actinomycetota bacterium]